MNKNNFIITALLLCGACAGRADEYVVKSSMPGLQDGMTVKLRNVEKEKAVLLTSDTVCNGRFELRGSVGAPTFCELEVSNRPLVTEKKDVRTYKTWVFLDNSRLTLEAPHVDSIGYVFHSMPCADERHYVTGSRLQEEFNAYRRALLPLELAAHVPDDKLSEMRFYRFRYKPDEYARLYAEQYPLLTAACAEVRNARLRFIQNYPQSAVSLLVADAIVKDAGDFGLTSGQLNSIVLVVGEVTADTARSARLFRRIKRARQLARGVRFGNLPLETLEGDTASLAAYVPAGRYTLVDFWASWCGPCRAALPQVKELFRQYDGRLAVVSVSCDDKVAAWKRAVREEKLTEWPQLRSATEQSRYDISKYYNVTSIPNFVLIDPEGRLVLSTDDPQILAQVLICRLS